MRLLSKGDDERKSSQPNISSLKKKFIDSFSQDKAEGKQPYATTYSSRKIPNVSGYSHRYSRRNLQNRRNPQSQIRSGSNIYYSVLQPFALPTLSELRNYGHYQNGRRHGIRQETPYALYNTDVGIKKEPLIYINMQTTERQNLQDSQFKFRNDQAQNQYSQQQSVRTRTTPGYAAQLNHDQKPWLTETLQPLKPGNVTNEVTSVSMTDLNDREQRHGMIPKQGQNQEMQSQVQESTSNKPNEDQNQQQFLITQFPLHLLNRNNKGNETKFLKIIISPEEVKYIEKYSYDPQKLYHTKSEKTYKENQDENLQLPMMDALLPQRVTSSSHFNAMEMQNEREMTLQNPQKMTLQQPDEMQKHKEVEEKNKEKLVEVLKQEIVSLEKQKEIRQQFSDKISETVSQQIMDLLRYLTRDIATQTEMKGQQQKPSAQLYQSYAVIPLEGIKRPEEAEMRKQPDVGNQTLATMQMQKHILMAKLLQQIEEMQKQNTANLEAERDIDSTPPNGMQTEVPMELLDFGRKAQSARDRKEIAKQNLMKRLVQKLTEMKQKKSGEAQLEMNMQKQIITEKPLKREENIEEQSTADSQKSEDMEMQMMQVMEMLLENITEMRKTQLDHQATQPEEMGMSLQNPMDLVRYDAIKLQPQFTRSNIPTQIHMFQRKPTNELHQQLMGAQKQETVQIPNRETLEKVNEQINNMNYEHLLQMLGNETMSTNAAIQTEMVSDESSATNRAKLQSNNQEQQTGNFAKSRDETIGYRQVFIHIPNRLTKLPRNFAQHSNQRISVETTSLNNETDENSNDEIGNSGKYLSYSSISNQEATVPQNLRTPNGPVIPKQKFPIESNFYDQYHSRPISSNSPVIYESSSFPREISSPLFRESPSYPVYSSNLFSYDGETKANPFHNRPQIYKD